MTDRFVLEKHVTSGVTSEGYLAFDSKHDKKVRLRRIQSTLSTEELATLQELLTSAKNRIDLIENSSVLKYNAIGTDDEGVWVSLPYRNGVQIQGPGLLPMSIDNFGQLAVQCLEALAAIHSQNIVHGALDTNSIHLIMPEMPGASMDYFIRDLGMRDILIAVKNEVAMNSLASQTTILAPELFEGQQADVTSDLYMLGQLFYYYLLGGHPFADLDSNSARSHHLNHELPLASNINNIIPVEIALWIDKLTQPNKQDRFQSAMEALAASPFVQVQPTATTQVHATTSMHTAETLNTTSTTQAQHIAPDITSQSSGHSNKLLYSILGLLALCLVAGSILYLLHTANNEKPSDSSENSSVIITVDKGIALS